MDKILNRNIKELIDAFPPVAGILDKFGIGCTACSLGTCRLRDIIEIHTLSEAQERELFTEIAAIIYPGKTVDIPRLARTNATAATSKKLSPPMRILVDEHMHIMKVINALPRLLESIETTLPEKKKTLLDTIEFIRNYADRFHHAKEEDLLFKLFDEAADIITVMYADHDAGRKHIRAASNAIEAGDGVIVREHLAAYGALLTQHIHKEDELLYPWMDRQLTDSQVGMLYSKFAEVAIAFGDNPERHINFADSLTKDLYLTT